MSIPLDRLYHYIESVAQDVYGDTIIYHFYPHGSKKIDDLTCNSSSTTPSQLLMNLPIYCNDQEPLNFDLYKNHYGIIDNIPELSNFADNNDLLLRNLFKYDNIYNRAILLHSERNSQEVEKYVDSNLCVPVYYWCHAIIAKDWFRYAQYHQFLKNPIRRRFLIYNRAWSGTREYRLKFAELLFKNQLNKHCQTSIGVVDNNIHFKDYKFINPTWRPDCNLEQHFINNVSTSCSSADFNIDDYQSTDIEVVLETLFDDTRLHLTEKTLRPIACGQPFILCATPGSLEYLKDYGFKTYSDYFDESYDLELNPIKRLYKIINTMKQIQNWNKNEFNYNIEHMQTVANYNKKWFFSSEFDSRITSELHENLKNGIKEIENTNTSDLFLKTRRLLASNNILRRLVLDGHRSSVLFPTRLESVDVLKKARSYYNRYYNK